MPQNETTKSRISSIPGCPAADEHGNTDPNSIRTAAAIMRQSEKVVAVAPSNDHQQPETKNCHCLFGSCGCDLSRSSNTRHKKSVWF